MRGSSATNVGWMRAAEGHASKAAPRSGSAAQARMMRAVFWDLLRMLKRSRRLWLAPLIYPLALLGLAEERKPQA